MPSFAPIARRCSVAEPFTEPMRQRSAPQNRWILWQASSSASVAVA